MRGELFLVGGAAMALAYSTRRSTGDLDAIFEPTSVIYDIAADIARERSLPTTWLNDGVKGFLPGADPNASPRSTSMATARSNPRFSTSSPNSSGNCDRSSARAQDEEVLAAARFDVGRERQLGAEAREPVR